MTQASYSLSNQTLYKIKSYLPELPQFESPDPSFKGFIVRLIYRFLWEESIHLFHRLKHPVIKSM